MKFQSVENLFIEDIQLTDGSWYALEGKYSFVIGYIEGYGYYASYKDAEYIGQQSSHFIDNSDHLPFKTLQTAEAACRRKFKELKKN